MKKFREVGFKSVLFLLAIICCCPFLMIRNFRNIASAKSENNFENVSNISINTALNANSTSNKSLIEKGTSNFVQGNIYSPKINNGYNETMNFYIEQTVFDASQSFYMWLFIPNLTVQDLVVTLKDSSSNSYTWKCSGLPLYATGSDYTHSFYNLLLDYSGQIKKGWKLVEFSVNDAQKHGTLNNINFISVKYSFLDEYKIADDFSIFNMFIADKKTNNSAIIDHQEYTVYAEKENNLDEKTDVYIGDKISIKNEKDFFEYVIIGKQNILEDQSGYVWNIELTKPTGSKTNLSFVKPIDILFEEKGYYTIDIRLTPINTTNYPLVSKDFRFFSEEFVFGYFQKKDNTFVAGYDNVLVLSLSNDFIIDDNQDFLINISNQDIINYKEIIVENNKAYIKINAKNIGDSVLTVSINGKKAGEKESKLYETSINVSVVEMPKNTDKTTVWIVFGILMGCFVIYLIILFVKSRRFGVN